MKIMYFDDYKLGVLKGDTVVDVSSAVRDIPHSGPHDLINGLIERFAQYRPRLEEALARAAAEGTNDVYQLSQLVRRTAGRWVNENYRRRPMIIPVLIEV